ncbi:hypothetical protein ACFTXM_46215 [Streptomyces sp. NPDC056930]|uniref:hypothetical protein n=1 Tax=Streptomyces sp. NPDC056930 TaxID=3345967 RepID=UPI003631F766
MRRLGLPHLSGTCRTGIGGVMGKSEQWPYNSTARARGLVLLALGVVKVATAEQLRQLVLPGTADTQTVRNACKDLRHAGLAESVGRTSSPGPTVSQCGGTCGT